MPERKVITVSEKLDIWTTYHVELRFLTRLSASVPAAADLQRKWLESRQPKNRPPESRSIDEIAAEVNATTPDDSEDIEERGLYVFQRIESGLCLRMATFRAHVKDCARVLSQLYVGKVEGEKSFSQRVLNAVYYPQTVYWVPILSQETEEPVKNPTGTYEKTIHVRTRMGERSAFKTMEYVTNAMLRFDMQILTPPSGKPAVSDRDFALIWEYGGAHGFSGERGDGEGRYEYRLSRDV